MRHRNTMQVVPGFICSAVVVVLAMTGIQARGQETPPPQAGNAEVAKIMREFSGRGDLGDGSAPRGPLETVAVLNVPGDLQVDLVVAEPQIAQPIHLSFDSQGRMWVVEYRQYPFPEGLKVVRYDQHLRAVFDRVPDAPPNHVRGADRISVLVDSDGDGNYDAQRVVIDGLNIATSVAVGRGGIWVMNPPYLLFYPDADGDAICDGDPEVHLSGFGLEDTHSVANSLILAPDGWLYGVNGSTTTARVEVPLGDQEAVAYEGQCVWRYHPEKHDFEIFAEGGGNPFGLEFDEEGQLFSGTNWGDTRGMHYVQGAYGVKSWGKHGPLTNPYAFGYFNHMPFKGDGRRFTEEFVIYDDNVLPERYRGQIIAVNPLHRIVFASQKIADTSTFRTEDFESLIKTEDRWFRPVDVTVGPDGKLYFADWYDTRLTHVDPRDNWHKSSGRIYRVGPKSLPDEGNTWDDVIPSRTQFDLKQVSSEQLLRVMESHPSRFFRHAAVEILAERKPAELIPVIRSHLLEPASQTLEGLWAYVRLAGAVEFGHDQELLTALGRSPNRNLRRWAVRLIGDERLTEPAAMEFLRSLAEREREPQVRSQLASTAKRIPGAPGASLALRMIQDDLDVDRDDLHSPLLLWWAVEGHVASDAAEIASALRSDASLWQSKLFCETILGRLAKRCAMQGSVESFGLVESLLQQFPSNELRDRLFR